MNRPAVRAFDRRFFISSGLSLSVSLSLSLFRSCLQLPLTTTRLWWWWSFLLIRGGGGCVSEVQWKWVKRGVLVRCVAGDRPEPVIPVAGTDTEGRSGDSVKLGEKMGGSGVCLVSQMEKL
ncbi:hypothetical protein Hanom_Chr05g00457791 [Helianthus anomalus]